MLKHEAITKPRQRTTIGTISAARAAPSQDVAPGQPADSGTLRAPTAIHDIGTIAIEQPQPQVGPAGGPISSASAGRIRARQGGGTPLAFPVQHRMEGAFGHNFADVRIHADGESDLLNRGIGAHAFTFGSDIFLGSQAASAGASGNDRLLAHELTHVVQQRGTGSGGPMTVAPVDAPSEREASAIAHDVAMSNAAVAQTPPTRSSGALQRVAAAPDAPAAPAAPATPADIAVQSAFNPMDINHKLLRAIDQEHVKIVGHESSGLYSSPIYKRNVEFNDTVAALSNLTAAQIAEVNKAYLAHEGRSLETDLFGGGESGYPADLTADQMVQLHALLGGTVAAGNAPEAEKHAADANAATAKAAELHRLLHGDLEKDDIERIMTVLRQDAKANGAVSAAYTIIGGDLRGDAFRMGPLAGQRAWKLLDGDITGADALKVHFDTLRIQGIDERIAKLQKDITDGESPYETMDDANEIKELLKERKEHVEDIEKRAEQAGGEARAGAQGDPTAAVQERMKQVLGDPDATATLVGGSDAALIRGMASDDPVPKAAAQLHKAAQSDDLKAEMLTATLRGLRTEAEARAQRAFPKGDPRIESETKRLADDYFTRIRSAYNSLISGDDKKFDELVDNLGDEGDTSVNIALMQSHGKMNDVAELIFALQGDRKDTATVERVLRDKSAKDIADLKEQYKARTGRMLDHDLFGEGATRGGQENQSNESYEYKSSGYGYGPVKVDQGKASGTSRLNLEDYLQRPDTEGGPKEVIYILSRAEREYQYTLANGGITGGIRDAFGNEERDLLDESIKEVRKLAIRYGILVGWMIITDPAGEEIGRPEMVQSQEAQALIVQMRMARATIRGDRDAYEKATAALRAIFEAVAMFVIQAALTALLSPAAAALLEAVELGADAVEAGVMAARIAKFAANTSVNIASTIGANLAIHGSDYSVAMLKADLLGGLGGSIGGEAVGKMLGPVAKGLTQKLGSKASQELIALAQTAGSIEGGAWAQGESGDLSLQNLVKTHIIGKAAGAVTHATGKVTGLAPEPGARPSAAPDETAAPAPEPVPQESHPATTPGNAPRQAPVPTGETTVAGSGASPATGGKQPATPEPLPSGAHTEEPSQTAAPKPTATEELPPGGRSPTEDDPTLVGAKPVDDEQTRVDWEPDIVHELPDGSAMWMDSPKETRAAYNESIRKDSRREVAIYRNRKTGETVIVQGTEGAFKVDLQVAHEALPGPPGAWELEAHYHPINEQTGVTRVPQRLPTSTNGDFAILEWQAQRTGNRAQRSRIDYIIEGDKRGYTEFSYEPGAEKPYKINYPDPMNGERVPLEFKTKADYEQWYRENFPNYRADIPTPLPVVSGVPGGHMSTKTGGGSGESEGEPGRAGANERGELDAINDENQRLVQGEGVAPLPKAGEEMTRSDARLRAAEERLQDPRATPKDLREAIEIVFERAVAEYRASFLLGGLEGGLTPGETRTLSSADLTDFCAGGRDVTAEAILARVGNSPHRITIERMQAEMLGFGAQHGFTIVTLPDGTQFLIDPTFAQFADPSSPSVPENLKRANQPPEDGPPLYLEGTSEAKQRFTAGRMLETTEGARLARDLMGKGFVRLGPEEARLYIIGLGADPNAAGTFTAQLLNGEAASLTEVVENGEVKRNLAPDESVRAAEHGIDMKVHAVDLIATVTDPNEGIVDKIGKALASVPANDPRRALLESLRDRLEQLRRTLRPLPEPEE